MDLSDRQAVDKDLSLLYSLIQTHHLWLCDRTLFYQKEYEINLRNSCQVDKWLVANFILKSILKKINNEEINFQCCYLFHEQIIQYLSDYYQAYIDLTEKTCNFNFFQKHIYYCLIKNFSQENNNKTDENNIFVDGLTFSDSSNVNRVEKPEKQERISLSLESKQNLILKDIFNKIAEGLVVIDRQGKVLFVNPAAEQIFDKPISRLIGESLGIPVMSKEVIEVEIFQNTGNYRIVRMRASEIFWEQEIAYLVYLNDITEFKQLEQKLKLLVQASEQSPISIVITDAKGNIEYVNSKFQELTGYTWEEVKGKKPSILKSGHTPEKIYRELWQTLLSGREWSGEFLNKKKNGELFWEQVSISPLKNEEGIITHFVAVKENITNRKESDALLSYQANYDALTSLPNRFLAMDRLRQAIHLCEREAERVAVMFIDLDKFKNVNDTLGHEYGDHLLQLASVRLMNCLRKSDTVARLGGDEFLVIISNLSAINQCEIIANKILTALKMPFNLLGEEVFISASIGITIYPEDGKDISLLMRNADTAMYSSKKSGRNTFRFYTRGMNEKAQQRIIIENQKREERVRSGE